MLDEVRLVNPIPRSVLPAVILPRLLRIAGGVFLNRGPRQNSWVNSGASHKRMAA